MPATEFNISSAIEIGEATRLDLTYTGAATARDYLFLLKNGNLPLYTTRLAADSNDTNITVEAGVKVAVELTDTQTLNYFQTSGMNYELYEKNPSVLNADFAMVLYGTIAAEDTVDPVDSDLKISSVASGYANKEIADIPVSSGLLFVRDSNGDLYYNNGTSWDQLSTMFSNSVTFETGNPFFTNFALPHATYDATIVIKDIADPTKNYVIKAINLGTVEDYLPITPYHEEGDSAYAQAKTGVYFSPNGINVDFSETGADIERECTVTIYVKGL